jgi:predicted enzyme related to lactoylglutathione lyase
VQDATYIETLAGALEFQQASTANVDAPRIKVSRSHLLTFTRALKSASTGDTVALPDNRTAKLNGKESLSSQRGCATLWRLTVEDGQTLIYSFLEKGANESRQSLPPKDARSHRVVLKLCVADLQLARKFYEQTLMLPLTDSSSSFLEFSGSLVIERSSKLSLQSSSHNDEASKLVVEVDDLKSMFIRLTTSGTTLRPMRRCENGGASFQLTDPFGNRVEVFSRKGM